MPKSYLTEEQIALALEDGSPLDSGLTTILPEDTDEDVDIEVTKISDNQLELLVGLNPTGAKFIDPQRFLITITKG